MSATRVQLNLDGFRALRTGAWAQGLVRAEAESVKDRADEGVNSDNDDDHLVHVHSGGTRARATVVTATPEAMLAEARHRNLTQSVHRHG